MQIRLFNELKYYSIKIKFLHFLKKYEKQIELKFIQMLFKFYANQPFKKRITKFKNFFFFQLKQFKLEKNQEADGFTKQKQNSFKFPPRKLF